MDYLSCCSSAEAAFAERAALSGAVGALRPSAAGECAILGETAASLLGETRRGETAAASQSSQASRGSTEEAVAAQIGLSWAQWRALSAPNSLLLKSHSVACFEEDEKKRARARGRLVPGLLGVLGFKEKGHGCFRTPLSHLCVCARERTLQKTRRDARLELACAVFEQKWADRTCSELCGQVTAGCDVHPQALRFSEF